MNRVTLLVGIVSYLLASLGIVSLTSCRTIDAGRSSHECISSRYAVMMLPQAKNPVYYVPVDKVDTEDCEENKRLICQRLVGIGKELVEVNNCHLKHPVGLFALNEELNAVGFEFMHAVQLSDCIHGPVPYGPYLPPSYEIYPFRDFVLNARDFRVSSLAPLKKLKYLEYIDFGEVGYGSQLWASLRDLASDGSLKGLSFFYADELLRFRDGTVVPEIRGIAAHVRSLEEIYEIDAAFPNLAYLSLSLSRELFNEFVRAGMPDKMIFQNLRAINLTNARYASDFANLSRNEELIASGGNKPFQLNYRWLPGNVSIAIIDGNLLNTHEMREWGYMTSSDPRSVDFVYRGLGYATCNARAFDYENDMPKLERIWRSGGCGKVRRPEDR